MKKTFSLLCVSAMVLSLAACGSSQTGSNTDTAYADTTVIGQVTAINGNSVTLQLGTLSESDAKPASPNASSSADNTSDTQAPPDKPAENDSGTNDTAPPAMQSGDETDSNNQTPPDRPEESESVNNESSSDNSVPEEASGSTSSDSGASAPPDKPDNDNNIGNPLSGSPGSSQSFTAGEETITIDLSSAEITLDGSPASISDIAADDILNVTFDSSGTVSSVEVVNLSSGTPGNMSNSSFGGGSGTIEQGDSANTVSEDSSISDTTYTSTGDNENALRIDGATVTLSGITVDKSAGASSNTESGDFYGMNAALLATNGATVTIENATINSSAQNGNGVFSYGSGTTVNISDSTITTTADNSGGIQTTGGATTNASNLTVETSGNSSAAIRSDRGGGTVNVDGGTYTSNGYNSPAIYSTAAITVKNALLTANNSEALVIEGNNSITLSNCDVTGNMSDTKGTSSDENVHNVMIYQSMSGDAEVGTSSFSMTSGSLTAKNGDMFYITNTDCSIYLSGVAITNEDNDANLMTISGNSASHGWGTAGANGAQVTFTAEDQSLEGNIVVDSISTLDMTLTGNSTFTGTINIVDNEEGGTAVANNAVITVGSNCVWTLTGNCTITSLTNNGTINFNGYTITLADGTVLS